MYKPISSKTDLSLDFEYGFTALYKYCFLFVKCTFITQVDLTHMITEDKNLTRGEWKLLQARMVRNVNKYDCCPNPYIDIDMSLLLHRDAPAYAYTIQLPIVGE